jgi:hypothetical protein
MENTKQGDSRNSILEAIACPLPQLAALSGVMTYASLSVSPSKNCRVSSVATPKGDCTDSILPHGNGMNKSACGRSSRRHFLALDLRDQFPESI